MRPPENAPRKLLVEGVDDLNTIIHLMTRHDIDWDSWSEKDKRIPHVYSCGGYSPLLESLGVFAKTIQKLGILIDANEHPFDRWRQVKGRLSKNNISLPDNPASDGVIVPGFNPDWKIGVWLMPDNSLPGQLENFLATLIPPDDPCWPYAQEATQHAKSIGAAFQDNDFLKARIHTWLAWQSEPGKPFGTAIKAAFFNYDSPVALKFVDWFKKLFLE